MTDFIIVGRGLSATVLMHAFQEAGITFRTIGVSYMSSSSLVAAGLWNPVVFKRMTASWKAEELIAALLPFYRKSEKKTGGRFLFERQIIRSFSEEQEEELWTKRSQSSLGKLLDPVIHRDNDRFPGCIIRRGYGIVHQAGNLDVASFIASSGSYFSDVIADEVFDHSALEVSDSNVKYKGHAARSIVFCEGYLMQDNPFFRWVPLKPAKGEVLTIEADGVDTRGNIFNRNGFMLPVSEGTFRVGATFAWDDISEQPTEKGRADLEARVRAMTGCSYAVTDHKAGIRPATHDLRPVAGRHPALERLFVFNGLGAKGVMIAPYLAKNFVHFYLQNQSIDPEADAARYYHLYGG